MLVARLLYPVTALGPGKRIAIWLCGCHRRCPSCANPELQSFDPSREVSVSNLVRMVHSISLAREVDGITITGGEPFEQAEELLEFLLSVREQVSDILVFSGYTLPQLKARKDSATDQVLRNIDVLIDGEYIDEQNNGSALRGSDNQVIHLFKMALQGAYEQYLDEGRKFENFQTAEGIVSVGLHYRGFGSDLNNILQKRIKSTLSSQMMIDGDDLD